jgi:Secretion system C-terminal sorting domain
MKKILFSLIAVTFIGVSVFSQNTHTIGTVPANYGNTSMPGGSYVIPMDNTNQQSAATATFNLRAYGLIVHLLNNNVRVRWVIEAQKAKDGIDFTVNASRVKPTAVAAANLNFSGGPFVIFAADLPVNIGTLIDNYNNLFAANQRVNVYQTNASVSVDVRFDYLINGVIWKPKAAILDDGGNADIHAGYFIQTGIIDGCSTPTVSGNGKYNGADQTATNWNIELTPAFVTNCYTFASEPHNDKDTTLVVQANPLITTGTIIRDIRSFVQNGGNFLAQCHAIWTYENYYGSGPVTPGTGGRFFTKHGIFRGVNAGTNATLSPLAYVHPDLSYSQFVGALDANKGGSLYNFKLNTTAGNMWVNSEEHHVSGTGAQVDIATTGVSKLTASNQLGGMVFYLGNHTFGDDDADVTVVNGLRMYMNAFLTPTNPQGTLQSSAVVHCSTFGSQTTVNVSSASGPSNAYPLTFKLYEDFPPAGIGGPDVQLGSTATFTAAGQPFQTINSGHFGGSHNYYVLVTPNSLCLQPIIYQSVCSTLPVEMKNFTAARLQQSTTVNLKWTTSTEINNTGFEVQRSLGNNNWQSVAFVNSQASGGNSTSDINYSFNDLNTSKSVSQYRLRQIDVDARSKYSEIRSVRGLDQKGGIIIYPNPTNDGKVNVIFEDINAIYDISVVDMSGRMIKQMKNITSNSIQIDNLAPGMYTLRVVVPETGEQTVEKIVVNKR